MFGSDEMNDKERLLSILDQGFNILRDAEGIPDYLKKELAHQIKEDDFKEIVFHANYDQMISVGLGGDQLKIKSRIFYDLIKRRSKKTALKISKLIADFLRSILGSLCSISEIPPWLELVKELVDMVSIVITSEMILPLPTPGNTT